MELVYYTGLFLFGGVAGFFLARFLRPKVHQSDNSELISLRTRLEALESQLGTANEELKQEREVVSTGRERIASIEAEKKSLQERMAEHEGAMKKLQEENRLQFENLAKKILETNTAKFQEHSQKTIGEIVMPLKQEFNDFRKTVNESFGAQGQQQRSLKEEISRVVMTANNLTQALKSDNKVQGNWGEIVLERILEQAGLRKGHDFTAQGEGLGLKEAETGRAQKPDFIVHLPEGKHLIIDSKVSLTHYEQLCTSTDEAESELLIKQFVQSIRNHVQGLADRRYQDTDKLGSPDFVLMFLPIEGAWSLAMQQDMSLHGFAWDKRVAIVGPTTLFATMRTVESLWRIEKQNRNTLAIAEAGGKLYDKLAGFVKDMEGLGRQLTTVQNTYESAVNKFSKGRGNVVSRAEKLKQLGIKAAKQMPVDWVDTDGEIDEEDESEDELPALEAASS